MPLLRGHGHSHGEGGHGPGGHSHGASNGTGAPSNFVESAVSVERPTLSPGSGVGKVLFLDAFSGIAGDMTIASLLDLGVPRSVVDGVITALGLRGVDLAVRRGHVGAIGATHVDVVVTGEQSERSYSEIKAMIDASGLAPSVKEKAQAIFLRLAEAEAEVHRIDMSEVHFHEVGAVDAIVDIVGSAACFDYLGAEVVATALPMGRGFVECRHGTLPLPAPATVLCLRGVPTYDAGIEGELVTPTGAAIVGAMASRFVSWPALGPSAVGFGAGTRTLADRPNALRAVLGALQSDDKRSDATHAVLETNVDDMTGELVGHVIERLLEGGALDVWAVASTTKKGRPGLVLSALARLSDAGRVSDAILRETSSIGVRCVPVSRTELVRRMTEVDTRYGKVPVKVSGEPPLKAKPEFDACAKLAAERGVTVREVLAEATRAAEDFLARQGR